MNRNLLAVAEEFADIVPDKVTLAAGAKDQLDALASGLVGPGPREIDSVGWMRAARTASCELPSQLRVPLRQFCRDPGIEGFMLLRGLPVHEERLPPTPAVSQSAQRLAAHPAAMLALIALQLGEIVAYREEKGGVLVQDVVPVPGLETLQGNAGSAELALHVENAFHVHRPDFVCLLCLRADHARTAGLRVAACRKAIRLLPERVRRVLHEPRFTTTPPASFGGRAVAVVPHAILEGSPEDPDLRVDFVSTQPADDEARRSMIELGRALVEVQRTLVLAPGDLAIVDNRVTVHGRTAFRPRYDGMDRWLQRVFVHLDFRGSREFRPADGHVVHSV